MPFTSGEIPDQYAFAFAWLINESGEERVLGVLEVLEVVRSIVRFGGSQSDGREVASQVNCVEVTKLTLI